MSIFISIVVFGLAVYLFFITNNKIKNIKENIIIEDIKKELESLVTEFNGAAARNIELIETKINDLQELLKKANLKMGQLDDKIERANRPFIVERVVEKEKAAPDKAKQPAIENQKNKAVHVQPKKESSEKRVSEIQMKEAVQASAEEAESIAPPAMNTEEKAPETEELSRSGRLKQLIRGGKTKEELLVLGFMENEINLLSFLIKKEN